MPLLLSICLSMDGQQGVNMVDIFGGEFEDMEVYAPGAGDELGELARFPYDE